MRIHARAHVHLSVCALVSSFARVCMCALRVHVRVCACVHLSMCMHVRMGEWVHVCTGIRVRGRMCSRVHGRMSVWTHVGFTCAGVACHQFTCLYVHLSFFGTQSGISACVPLQVLVCVCASVLGVRMCVRELVRTNLHACVHAFMPLCISLCLYLLCAPIYGNDRHSVLYKVVTTVFAFTVAATEAAVGVAVSFPRRGSQVLFIFTSLGCVRGRMCACACACACVGALVRAYICTQTHA